MGAFLLLGAVLTVQPGPHILSVLDGAEFAERGIVGEIVERPAGITDERFAQHLIDTEGLQPWDGRQLEFPVAEDRPAAKAVSSGDGREIVVYYVPSETGRAGRVCRLRSARGGMSNARWQAFRWCAATFGYLLPETPPSPVATVRQPPPR